MTTVYEAAGGADGMLRLADAWHRRVMADPVVSHAFSHGFRADHTERLAAYLGEALGGPQTYTKSMGTESDVVRMHSGNGVHEEMDRLALVAWDRAIEDCGLDADPALRATLHDYWADGIRRMAEHHETPDTVPDGLPLQRWVLG
ncbi:group II truncated hemoglobin [Knoellia subterranea]|uniref:Oxidoreductase n=1 Tax=Knoellia subterranea KCTC 19937 TaxID=1385521 RepID=A0A0A0JIU2_9MICO|nr:group II truncated hemoglobin [Knoellia subterranea]KGN36689.1 oxidoreductase [Knoellia subterranea KCTC 19937]